MVIDAIGGAAAGGTARAGQTSRTVTVEARVLAVTEVGTVRLATANGEMEIPLALLMERAGSLKPGMTLNLAFQSPVTAGGAAAVAAAATTTAQAQTEAAPDPRAAAAAELQAAIGAAVGRAAGRQDGMARLFADLTRLGALPARELPADLRVAVAAVLGRRLDLDRPIDAGAIRRVVAGSGLFLESGLARDGAVPAGDLKAALIKLQDAVDRFVAATPRAPAGGAAAAGPAAAPLQAPDMSASAIPAAPAGPPVAAQPPTAGAGLPAAASNPAAGASPELATTPPVGAPAATPGPALPSATSGPAPQPAAPGSASPPATTGLAAQPATAGLAAPPGTTGPAALAATVAPSVPSGTTGPASAAVPPWPAAPAAVAGSAPVPTAAGWPASGGGEAVELPPNPGGAGLRPGAAPAASPSAGAPAAEDRPGTPAPGDPAFPLAPAGAGRAEAQVLARVLKDLAGLVDGFARALPAEPAAEDEPASPARAASAHPLAAPGDRPGDQRDVPPRQPPPRAGALPLAEPPARPLSAPDADAGEIARVVAEETDAALARLTLSQFASLAPEDKPGQPERQDRQWTFDVPILTRGETSVAQFRIERDESGRKPSGEPEAPVWRIRFSMTLEPVGPVHAALSLRGQHLSVGIFAERPAAAHWLSQEVGTLTAALAEANLEVDDVHLAAGKPPAPRLPGSGAYLDRNA